MEYTLTNKYCNIIRVTIQCSYTFNVIHFMSGQQLYMFNYQWMTISTGRHIIELLFQTGFAPEMLQEAGRRQGSCIPNLCALCASRGVKHLLPKSWHYTTQHNYQLDTRDSNVLCALETLPLLRDGDCTKTCTKGAIAIIANTVERDSRERLT